MAMCSLKKNKETGKFEKVSFAGAYNPLYILRDGEIVEFKATRNPV